MGNRYKILSKYFKKMVANVFVYYTNVCIGVNRIYFLVQKDEVLVSKHYAKKNKDEIVVNRI